MEHKLIQDGKLWLPFARSRIKALRATGLPYASQKYTMPDGALCVVWIEPGHEYIRIDGEQPSLYEFFTTGPVLNIDTSVPGYSVYRGYGVNVLVDNANKTLKGVPVGSTLESSHETPPKWTYKPGANDMSKLMPHKNAFQVQGAIEHQYFPKLKPPLFVASCWTGASQINYLTQRGMNTPSGFLYDVGYDIAPEVFRTTGYPVGKTGLAPDTDWYRRAALRTVQSDDYGSRQLVLMTDATGKLHVYPTTEQDATLANASPYAGQAIKTNVPSDVVQSQPIPFPAWVRTSTSMARDNFPEPPSTGAYRWEFNSLATRMVCVLASDMSAVVYGVTTDDPTLIGKPTNLYATRDTPSKTLESLPGLLEIQIDITLTGPNAKDFSLALSVSDEVAPTSDTYVIAADYHWGDLPEITTPGPIAKDSLIYMTVDIYHKRLEGPPPSGQSEAGFTSMHAQAKVINRADARVLREFMMHTADAPYGMDGVPYAGSFLEAYRNKVHAAAGKLNSNTVHDSHMSTLTSAFVVDSDAFTAALTAVSCDAIAQYDKIAQKYLDDMRDYVRSPAMVSTWGTAAVAEYNKESLRQKFYLSRMLGMPEDLITLKTWILAYDLRVLAFATQTAAFKNIGNQTTRQDRVQVIVRNQVVHTADAPDPTFAALISAADTPWVPDSDWVRLGVMSTVNPKDSIQGFRSLVARQQDFYIGLDIYDPRFVGIGVSPLSREDFNVSYPHGGVAYNFYAQSFLSMEADDVFCVHPAGHWAITVKPVVYYSGASTHVYPWSTTAAPDIDAGAFVQQMVDIVNVRVTGTDESGAKTVEDFKAKHLDLFNQAYGKTVQLTDFNLTFGHATDIVLSGQITTKTASATSPNLPVARVAKWIQSDFINDAGDTYGVAANRAPSYFGVRDLSNAQSYTTLQYFEDHIFASSGDIGDAQANLRGACLFTGKLTQR